MKALTVCQPYAELLMPRRVKALPEKQVENRTWSTRYRGWLLIHAGKSRQWLDLHAPYPGEPGIVMDRRYDVDLLEMAFGALIGKAMLVDCVHISQILSGACDERYPWIRAHPHAEGPWCFVMDSAIRFERPIPYRGAQGFFEVPDHLVSHVHA